MERMLQLTSRMYRLSLLMLLSLTFYCIKAQANEKQGEGDIKINLTATAIPLKDVFKAIQKQSGLFVMYSNSQSQINREEKVSVSFKQARLDDVLSTLFGPRHLGWRYSDKTIVLYVKPEEVSETKKNGSDSSITTVAVTGNVTDPKGTPIPGATIQVKGSKDGVTTDESGRFFLHSVPTNTVLVVSSVGFEAREVSVKGKSLLIQLNVNVNELEETVIKGYYNTTKKLNTGNVTTIKGEDIAKQPVANPLAAIAGRVPGMFITQNTGVPGGSFDVLIRGRSSLNTDVNNDPLFIIDGIPYASRLLTNLNGVGRGGNPLNFINLADIQSIDILKDADATSIYGSRGANGVVLITTKKGTAGNTKVDFNVYSGIGRVTRKVDWLNTKEYLQMRNEAFKNDNVIPDQFSAPDLLLWDTTRYTDWQKTLIGGTAHYTDAQVSISGGNINTQYLISAGYHKESTVFPGDGSDQKGSVRFNIQSTSPNQRFKINLSGNYVVDYNTLVSADFTSSIPFLAPNAPSIYNSDGTLNWANSTWANPFAALVSRYKGKTNNLISNSRLEYSLLKGLNIIANLGYTNLQVNETIPYPIAAIDPAFNISTGSANFSNKNITTYLLEPQISYETGLAKGKLSTLLGSSFQQTMNSGQAIFADGFTSDALLENISAASTLKSSVTDSRYKYISAFGRINYNLSDKYILNLTARRDGSSRFGPGKQFANFGAIGAAWIFSKEQFFKEYVRFISFGKLRGSYGTTGNDQIPNYGYLDLYNPSRGNAYQGITGLFPVNLFNPDFAWEQSKKVEIAIELGFVKDRIVSSFSFFRNRTSNQLVNYSLPTLTGFSSLPYYNLPATVENKGVEIALSSTNISTDNFQWETSLNLTIPYNKLLSYPNFEASSYANNLIIGKPITIIKVYHLTGVDPATGVYQFADSKGNVTNTPDYLTDRNVIINTAPRYYGGLSNSIKYKRFALDIFMQFVKQTAQNFFHNYMPGYYYYGGYNQPKSVLGRWQKPGDRSMVQKFTQSDFSVGDAYSNADMSDYSYGDASFIRLKNVSISWSVPQYWLNRIHIANLRAFLQCQNLLTITKYKGLDPENGTVNALPPLKVITAGVQINL